MDPTSKEAVASLVAMLSQGVAPTRCARELGVPVAVAERARRALESGRGPTQCDLREECRVVLCACASASGPLLVARVGRGCVLLGGTRPPDGRVREVARWEVSSVRLRRVLNQAVRSATERLD